MTGRGDGLFRSRAGFGLGRLHHVFSSSERERIVLGALDAGFSHFDLAPPYGDGLCEAEAGRILRGRRDRVALATKFGIAGSSLGARDIPVYFAIKALRKAFSPTYGAEYSRRDFSSGALVKSLEQSLRRLRTDHVDFLFYHEPRDAADVTAMAESVETMERLRREGKVLHYGVSARAARLLSIRPPLGDVVQFELGPHSRDLVAGLPEGMSTSCFGLVRHRRDASPPGRLDYGGLLRWFFENYPGTMPILATNRPDQIKEMGRAIAELPRVSSHASSPPLRSDRPGGSPA